MPKGPSHSALLTPGFWRRHRVLTVGFVLALVLVLLFGLRLIVAAHYWSQPAHTDRPIEGWMPVGYVAMSWDVPREVLAETLGIEPGSQAHKSLATLASERGVGVEVLTAQLLAAIAAHREGAP